MCFFCNFTYIFFFNIYLKFFKFVFKLLKNLICLDFNLVSQLKRNSSVFVFNDGFIFRKLSLLLSRLNVRKKKLWRSNKFFPRFYLKFSHKVNLGFFSFINNNFDFLNKLNN